MTMAQTQKISTGEVNVFIDGKPAGRATNADFCVKHHHQNIVPDPRDGESYQRYIATGECPRVYNGCTASLELVGEIKLSLLAHNCFRARIGQLGTPSTHSIELVKQVENEDPDFLTEFDAWWDNQVRKRFGPEFAACPKKEETVKFDNCTPIEIGRELARFVVYVHPHGS